MATTNREQNTVTILRRELGLTQQEMAHRVGVAIRTLVSWEKGESRPRLSLSQVKQLLEVTGRSLDELIVIFGENGGEVEGGNQSGARLKRLK